MRRHTTGPSGEPTGAARNDELETSDTSRRRLVVGLAAAVVVAGGAAVGINATWASDDPEDRGQPFAGATEQVLRGDLEGSTSVAGTLRFAPGQPILAGRDGVVTGLPRPGQVVAPGQRLYDVDNQPTFLLQGALPAWRDFAPGMDDGPDVLQLERNLRRLGFFVLEPDDHFTWSTSEAIEDWQEDEGVEETGRLPLGSVVFADHSLRVGTLTGRPGDRISIGAELYGTTSTKQVVELDVGLADQRLAVIGRRVTIRLPDGTQTKGRISSVGTPTERTGDDGSTKTVIPVVVTLRRPGAAAAFQEASVTVDLPSETRKDVLSVPVAALVALTEDQLGVEVVDPDGTTRKVPVTTGMFAAGRVEVSGEGIEAGLDVVVPQR